MSDKTKIILCISLTIVIIFLSYIIFNKDKTIENGEENNSYVAKVIEDECTEEYEQMQNVASVVAIKEKLSSNAILILKKYYKDCDHTLNEYVELPQELVNMTEEEVSAYYKDWEVIGFENSKLTLYKEFDNPCDEHFKLKLEDGKVVIYIINADGTESVYEKTNISGEYLTETDLLNMQEGLKIYGKEELNQVLEDFE